MQVYISPQVADVIALHPYLADAGFRAQPIRDQLDKQAQTVVTAHRNRDSRILMQMSSWLLGASGQPIMDMPCDIAAMLIDMGANPSSTANMYGGGQTPFDLSSTSAHPHHAGIAPALNAALSP